jgi:hypothetical protein
LVYNAGSSFLGHSACAKQMLFSAKARISMQIVEMSILLNLTMVLTALLFINNWPSGSCDLVNETVAAAGVLTLSPLPLLLTSNFLLLFDFHLFLL